MIRNRRELRVRSSSCRLGGWKCWDVECNVVGIALAKPTQVSKLLVSSLTRGGTDAPQRHMWIGQPRIAHINQLLAQCQINSEGRHAFERLGMISLLGHTVIRLVCLAEQFHHECADRAKETGKGACFAEL